MNIGSYCDQIWVIVLFKNVLVSLFSSSGNFISFEFLWVTLQIGEEVCQGCISSLCLFNLYAEYIMQNARLDEAQAGIKIAGRNISNRRYTDDTTLMAESEEELKSLLWKVKEESEKAGLKLSIQKMKTMASGPITSWKIDGETMETMRDFIFLGPKITADGDCSHEIKTLAPWKKSYDQPRQHIKKQRHYFANKGLSSQSYGFSSSHVWMWELDHKEGWMLKNWCFWTVVMEKTLESPLDCKEIQPVHSKGDQSWVFIGRTDAEAEAPILCPLMWRTYQWKTPWCWERLKAERDDTGWDGWMASSTRWI